MNVRGEPLPANVDAERPSELSRIERRVLDFMIEYLKRNTYQPSVREIGKRFGIRSTKTVSQLLDSLTAKGYIDRAGSRSRAVRIHGLRLQEPGTVEVPLYGKIAAGRPALREEHVAERFEVDPKLLSSSDAFFMKVIGDSMKGVGILDGDLVLVDPCSEEGVKNGEIVAVRVRGEGAVKRYFRRGEQVVLEPANTDYAPILVREYDDFTVLGRVGGLFRRFTARQTEVVGS